MDSNTEAVLHLKKKLDKGVSFEKTMHILYKLQKIPISIKLLEETGIGFKVRELSKAQKSNDIGKTAKLLTMNWKEYVRKNNEKRSSGGHSGSEGEGHSSEEQLQPQVNSRSNDDDEDRKGHRSSRESSSKHQHKHHHHSSGHSHRHNHRIEVNNDSDQEDHHRQNETPRSEDGSVNGGSSGGSSGAERNSSRTSKKHKKKHKKNKSSKSSSHNHSSHSHHNSNNNTNSGNIINLSDDSESEQERDRRKSKKRHREEEKQQKVVQPVTSSSSKSVNCDTTNQHHQVKRIRIKEPVAPPPPQQEDLFGMMLGASDRAPMTVLKNGSGTKSSTTPSTKSINPMGRSSSSSKVPTSNIYSSSSRKEPSSTSGLHHIDILNSLPDPNYRPNRTLPPPHQDLFSAYNAPDYGQSPTKRATDGDVRQPILPGTKLFKGRTAVYAGTAKLVTVPKVYPLQELCIKVLMNHVDQICEVGDLPYFLLKPVLLKCTVPQLKRIESYNPQLKEESDELWQEFCEKDFKGRHIEDSKYSTWRRFYNSLLSEREIKLRKITEGISSKARKAVPERKTQQIDLKTPREIRRKQERSTNPFFSPSGGGGGSSHRSSSSGYGGGGGGGGGSLGGMVTLANTKPKTAPLMKKLLQMRKSKFGGGGGAARR